MRVEAVTRSNREFTLSFGRKLAPEEREEYVKTLQAAKKQVGNDGRAVFIVHDPCLPQAVDRNTGVGNLSAKKSMEFFDFIRTYMGIDTVEVLPPGELSPLCDGKFYCAYSSTALSLSPHHINLELLTTPKYGALISSEDINKIVASNKLPEKETLVNFENIVLRNSLFDSVLRKYFLRFQLADNLSELQNRFDVYKAGNADWLEPKVIFQALVSEYGHDRWKEWSDFDRDLMVNSSNEAKERISFLQSKYAQDGEFYRFKQFLADTHLAEAREGLNTRGMKLVGDCLFGYGPDEFWAYPQAFKNDCSMGWGLPSLDFESIMDPNSTVYKLLKKKVQLFAQRYDSIRFDVSWAYVQSHLTPFSGGEAYHGKDFGDSLLELIESHVREIKGDEFDVSNLIHEFDAGPEDFTMVENYGMGDEWRRPLQNRTKALGTTYMSPTWGSNEHYLRLNHQNPNFILGAGNHDPQPLREIAEGIPDIDGRVHKYNNIEYLRQFFNISESILQNPVEFIRTKFAEIMTAKNNQYFYVDALGIEGRFDSQTQNGYRNYRLKIPSDFEQSYIEAVQKGYAFNPMEALSRLFRLRGLDKTHSELYSRVIHFNSVLMEKVEQTGQKFDISQTRTKNPAIIVCTAVGALLAGGYAYLKSYGEKQKQG